MLSWLNHDWGPITSQCLCVPSSCWFLRRRRYNRWQLRVGKPCFLSNRWPCFPLNEENSGYESGDRREKAHVDMRGTFERSKWMGLCIIAETFFLSVHCISYLLLCNKISLNMHLKTANIYDPPGFLWVGNLGWLSWVVLALSSSQGCSQAVG